MAHVLDDDAHGVVCKTRLHILHFSYIDMDFHVPPQRPYPVCHSPQPAKIERLAAAVPLDLCPKPADAHLVEMCEFRIRDRLSRHRDSAQYGTGLGQRVEHRRVVRSIDARLAEDRPFDAVSGVHRTEFRQECVVRRVPTSVDIFAAGPGTEDMSMAVATSGGESNALGHLWSPLTEMRIEVGFWNPPQNTPSRGRQ
jgi:hypothetical protein